MKDVIAAGAVCALLCAASTANVVHADAPQDVAPGLKVGDVLDQHNWQSAKDLLPPEILRHYEKGEYKNKIVPYPAGNTHWEKAFEQATEENATRLDVDEHGTIIDRTTGKQPPYYYGIPFPRVDAKDPHAGVKIVWNQFLAYWSGGNSFTKTVVGMLNPKGFDRELVANGWFSFNDGQSTKYRTPNPLNLQSQFLGVSTKPADLEGTASLTWRYRESDKRDSVWAFIPALRRVRAVSPANRSDGYLGSDISGDDGYFFDGKPEDFDWKLIGQRDALGIVEPHSIEGPLPIAPAPGGGWVTLTDLNPPTAGVWTSGWTGISWAPVDLALAKRSYWVVEGTPHDKYYLYGHLELWIDTETWSGAWNRKFSWAGELINTYQITASVNHKAGSPQDPEWVPAAAAAYACAENVKMNRATIAGMRPDPQAPFYRRVPMQSSLFDSQSLTRFGK